MAWWNQPEGSVTPTVTLRRLAAWLAGRGYGCDIDLSEGLVRCSAAGFDYVLMVVYRRILVVRAHHQLGGSAPGAVVLSQVRAVAQEVSSARLVPALYTEVDDAGLGLCAEVLVNIGTGLDDAQLAGTMDFVLDGVDEALREVLGRLGNGAMGGAGPDASAGCGVIRPPEAIETPVAGAPEAGPTATPLPDTIAVVEKAVEMAPSADGPGVGVPERAQAGTHADSAVGVKDDEGMVASGDADGGTGVETTNTSEPLFVS